MEEAQALQDFEIFTHHTPPTPAEQRKAEKQRKKEEKEQPPSARQINAAEKLADSVNKERTEKETIQLKRRLVREVKRYVKEFPDRVDAKLPRGFGTKMSLKEIQDVYDTVTLELNSGGGEQIMGQLYAQGVGVLQALAPRPWMPVKLALSGPRADLVGTLAVQRDEWMPIIKELSIKYERYFAMGPEKRLILFTARLITMVHDANTTHSVEPQEEPTPETREEFDALFSQQ